MPYIEHKNRLLHISNEEASLLNYLTEEINQTYAPIKLNYTSKDLASYFLNHEQEFVKAIHKTLANFKPYPFDKIQKFEEVAGYPITKYLSRKADGSLYMHNENNTIFNLLFVYSFMNPFTHKKILRDNLKDTSIFTPIKNVIKDNRILSIIYPDGFDKITLIDFLSAYSFSYSGYNRLKELDGIGPVSLAKINQSLSDFGYPLICGKEASLLNDVAEWGLYYRFIKLLLLTKEDLQKAGLPQYLIEKMCKTKYINRKPIEHIVTQPSEKTDIISTIDQAPEINTETEKKEENVEEKQPSQSNKYLKLIAKMPKSIIKNMIIKEFKSNLKLLLDLGKQDPQILLDYAECIPFKRYQKMEDIPQVMTIIRIQPKLIRKLETRMISLIESNLNPIVFSTTLTKGEQSSLNAYVNKKLDEYYAKVINKGIKSKTKK